MTDQQLDDLERLLRERDEAREACKSFRVRTKEGGKGANFGLASKEYGRLAEARRQAAWRCEEALVEVAPALIAEVRRLRSGVVAGLFYGCGCPARASDKVKLCCDTHYKPLVEAKP